MALSQDEQRMLAEIERRLAADDPGLASCLTTFRRPGPATVLRSPRARIIGSLFTVLLVAMVSLMIYAMIPFRTHLPRNEQSTTTSAPANATTLAASSTQPGRTQQSASTSTGAKSTASQPAADRSTSTTATSATSTTATGKRQQAGVKPTTAAMPGTP
jgi:cytoskeletal protein RodZ